jgi:hypothetical protein
MCLPEMARATVRRWISEVPSKIVEDGNTRSARVVEYRVMPSDQDEMAPS